MKLSVIDSIGIRIGAFKSCIAGRAKGDTDREVLLGRDLRFHGRGIEMEWLALIPVPVEPRGLYFDLEERLYAVDHEPECRTLRLPLGLVVRDEVRAIELVVPHLEQPLLGDATGLDLLDQTRVQLALFEIIEEIRRQQHVPRRERRREHVVLGSEIVREYISVHLRSCCHLEPSSPCAQFTAVAPLLTQKWNLCWVHCNAY